MLWFWLKQMESSKRNGPSIRRPTPDENRGVSTWAETTRKAIALDEIGDLIQRYLPPDSGITKAEVVAEIIGIIETRTGRQFLGQTKLVEPSE
jgi:hypothetical protein